MTCKGSASHTCSLFHTVGIPSSSGLHTCSLFHIVGIPVSSGLGIGLVCKDWVIEYDT